MGLPENLPRLWPTISLPGIIELRSTYWVVDLDAMPPIERPLDDSLSWLRDGARQQHSLERDRDAIPEREADTDGLRGLGARQPLPASFRRFVEDPEPRRHLRTATACFLDLGQFPVEVSDGGALLHFLSDQQWVVHWLLYAGPDGSEAVVAAQEPFGFDSGEGRADRAIDAANPPASMAVCSDSFSEFLYRFWAMNELFFRLAVDGVEPGQLPAELRTYAAGYPRSLSQAPFFT